MACYIESGHIGLIQPEEAVQFAPCGLCLTRFEPAGTVEGRARGPLALVLLALARAGIALDSHVVLHTFGRQPVSLMAAPWPMIRRALVETHQEAACRRLTLSRATFQGGQFVDVGISLYASSRMGSPSKHMLPALWSGGIWTPHESFKAGHIESMACPHCGAERADLRHIVWVCEATAHVRAKYLPF